MVVTLISPGVTSQVIRWRTGTITPHVSSLEVNTQSRCVPSQDGRDISRNVYLRNEKRLGDLCLYPVMAFENPRLVCQSDN